MTESSIEITQHVCERGREFEAISDMIVAAQKHGLLIEAVWSFGMARQGGDCIESAVQFALSEWDLSEPIEVGLKAQEAATIILLK
jgi:hypothetical protein